MRSREYYWNALQQIRGVAVFLNDKAKPFYCSLQQRRNDGIYAVNIDARVGFFAQLNWCLFIFAHCERFSLRPEIQLTSPFYVRSKGESWLEYFFDNRKLTPIDKYLLNSGDIKFSHISDIEQLGLSGDYDSTMSLEHANKIFWKYLAIRQEISEYVEAFTEKYFDKKNIIGIHYRGTDKSSEAPPVSREYVVATISNYINENPQVDSLFVASDEESFIKWIKNEIKDIEIIVHNDTERSKNTKAIHTQPSLGDNYTKGKEALVNSLLLSKCNVLVRSSSFLSAWSSIFNPSMPVIMLNKPFDSKLWFPDSLVIKKSMNRYLPYS